MDTATVAVVVTGVVSGVVGLSGLALAAWQERQRRETAREDRAHAWRLAHAERTYADRLAMYLDLLRYATRMGLVAERTDPIIGPKPPPPEWRTPDDELLDFDARVGALSSPEVEAAMDQVAARFSAFQVAAYTVARIQNTAEGGQVVAAMEQREDARREVFDGLRTLRRLVNVELAEL